ncbi:MAG: hypothetical protein HYS24_08905 [Ignavibacteriales bacterium]|nr:hypothetical protein [Ignavibacteriales bacterium]MBK7980659.1 hypothetical protein [Ignavibacteriota bacterium]
MEFTNMYSENYLKEDFVAETDEYINVLKLQKKKDLYLKIGMASVYVLLIIVSVIVV